MNPTLQVRADILWHLEQAQASLSAAATLASPLPGWGAQHRLIEQHYDATRTLWALINDAPLPLNPAPVSRCRCLDLNPHLTDR